MMPEIKKIYQILEVLQEHSQNGISNKELSEILQLPPSTSSRILTALSKYDFVFKRKSDSHYFLGFAHLRFAQSLLATNYEVALCHPMLDELYKKLGETVFYAKYNGSYCVVIEVHGAINTRIAVGLGEIMPLHCSAAGKAVFAFIPDFERNRMYQKLSLDRYTHNTPVDMQQLEKHIAAIQQSHISYNYSEFHEGINAVAAPVFNRYGSVIGSLAIVGTSARLDEQTMQRKGNILLAAAKKFSKQMVQIELS